MPIPKPAQEPEQQRPTRPSITKPLDTDEKLGEFLDRLALSVTAMKRHSQQATSTRNYEKRQSRASDTRKERTLMTLSNWQSSRNNAAKQNRQ